MNKIMYLMIGANEKGHPVADATGCLGK